LLAGAQHVLLHTAATPSKGKRNRTITFWENVTSSIFAHQIEKITTEK